MQILRVFFLSLTTSFHPLEGCLFGIEKDRIKQTCVNPFFFALLTFKCIDNRRLFISERLWIIASREEKYYKNQPSRFYLGKLLAYYIQMDIFLF